MSSPCGLVGLGTLRNSQGRHLGDYQRVTSGENSPRYTATAIRRALLLSSDCQCYSSGLGPIASAQKLSSCRADEDRPDQPRIDGIQRSDREAAQNPAPAGSGSAGETSHHDAAVAEQEEGQDRDPAVVTPEAGRAGGGEHDADEKAGADEPLEDWLQQRSDEVEAGQHWEV